jgi:phosphatidylserine/phosphatidylglycerophosphate/cardiolipin synthase-like enzyme
MEAYTQNIEQILLENFDSAKKSIIIVVAWFTNPKIISKLIELKKFKNLDIQILVDDNEINQKYFFQLHLSNLEESKIKVKSQQISKFNHNKFSIIDNEILITGSYNYTIKANRNFENIIIERDSRIADFYYRVFKFFTDKNYLDPNVEILFENFDFANKLISTYYPFSSKLMSKLKEQITLGYCYTHENGLYDEISYEPGLIFNSKFKLHKKLNEAVNKKKLNSNVLDSFDYNLTQEFDLPITKKLISNFRINEINNFNYQTIREIADFDNAKIDFEELAKDFENTEIALTKYYTRKFKTIYSNEELREILEKKIDLIIEDYIWINNFAPFLNESIVENIYRKICR